jgi:hypothetical protein
MAWGAVIAVGNSTLLLSIFRHLFTVLGVQYRRWYFLAFEGPISLLHSP